MPVEMNVGAVWGIVLTLILLEVPFKSDYKGFICGAMCYLGPFPVIDANRTEMDDNILRTATELQHSTRRTLRQQLLTVFCYHQRRDFRARQWGNLCETQAFVLSLWN